MISCGLILPLLILSLTNLSVFCHSGHDDEDKPNEVKVLIISLDGFRHDYLEKAEKSHRNISAFLHLWHHGVRIMQMKNVFMTRTFPNHISLATGLYLENHGIIDNIFYDPVRKEIFRYNNQSNQIDSTWFNNGLNSPFWINNERAGYKSAVFYWPGSLAAYGSDNKQATYTFGHYSDEPSLAYRLKWALDKLLMKDTRLACVYYHEPDNFGHRYGPDSVEILDKIEELNRDIGHLIELLHSQAYSSLKEQLNIILVSDHGMAAVDSQRLIDLDSILGTHDHYTTYDPIPAPVVGLWPNDNDETALYNALKMNKDPNFQVYLRENVPAEYHFGNNIRIPPIVLVSKVGWMITKSGINTTKLKGSHGYNNSQSDMHPFFLATGPSFRRNFTLPMASNLDVYPLLCHILSMNDQPACHHHNGSISLIQCILLGRCSGNGSDDNDDETHNTNLFLNTTFLTYVLSLGFITFLAGYYSLAVFRHYTRPIRYRSFSLNWSGKSDSKAAAAAASSAGSSGGGGKRASQSRFVNDNSGSGSGTVHGDAVRYVPLGSLDERAPMLHPANMDNAIMSEDDDDL